MAKTKLGFDIGNNSVKIAAVSKKKTRVFEIRLPDNMIADGEIAMPTAFSDFLKKQCRKMKVPKGESALVLSSGQALCRTVTLPKMSKDQLALNLPYEFSDFVQDDVDKYFYDYAMCEPESVEEDGEEDTQMTLMGAVASKERITRSIRMFSKAGFKLKTLLPEEMAMIQLVRRHLQAHPDGPKEYFFVNLGQEAIKITVVKNDRVQATRRIGFGCQQLDLAIADLLSVDPYLAGSYKLTNYQNVLNAPESMAFYQNAAVEILKVINFYQFNYRDNQVAGLYLIGGGAAIPQFRAQIEETTGMSALPLAELLPVGQLDEADAARALLAIGVAVD